ncbi:MAG: alpha/beta hydrolase [Halieaceae bacterium]|nr:alpha/beta hydrolase [Halieaceae bacterium]
MIKIIAKWIALSLVGLVLGLLLLLGLGSSLSLDRGYHHSSESRALPLFPRDSRTSLVRVAANGFEFRARIAGFESELNEIEKPAVILLHGFPVTSAMWIALIDPLLEAGFRVLAFDQRGYSPGARPDKPSEYAVDKLSADVIAVADAVGIKRFHLVGHDWGAAVGWATVLLHPERLLSWSALSIAHPAAFGQALQDDPDQQSRSSYFLLFTTPWLPEALFSFNSFSLLQAIYKGMSEKQISEYIQTFSEPGALTAALNWYRAMTLGPGTIDDLSLEVEAPTLFVWGNNDPAVGRAAVELQRQYLVGPYRNLELDAGHWLLAESPEQTIEAVVQHVTTYRDGIPQRR